MSDAAGVSTANPATSPVGSVAGGTEMTSAHVSVVIDAEPDDVYAFARDVDNLPRWAAGLATSSVTRDGDELVAESPMGAIRFTFCADNTFGVLDHDVRLPDGAVVHNPLRVMAHPAGAEVVFTPRQLAMSDDEFARDRTMVEADLVRLKQLVEAEGR